jgi:hypothetical protein
VNDHLRAGELIPWLANKRLEGDELAWLNSHLDGCPSCQAQLAGERHIVAALNTHATVEYAPQPSFNRLWARIEADSRAVRRDPAADSRPPSTSVRNRPYVQVAAAVLIAAGLGALAVQHASPPAATVYHTVTNTVPPAAPGSLKVIFSDAATMADVKLILGSAGLRVISGPSEAGIFTVGLSAAGAHHDLRSSLKALRDDPRVRFAEPSVSGG